MNWRDNPEAIARLLECSTDELESEFPGIHRKTLINRRGEFRRHPEWVPESNHSGGETTKTLGRSSSKLPLIPTVKERKDSASTAVRSGNKSSPNPADVGGATHFVIPDTQAKPGVPTAHLRWIGQYLVDHLAERPNVKVIHLGDHADMPSLSSYDKGKKSMEGRRVVEDIEAANEAFQILNQPLIDYNRGKRKQWWPERYMLLGNHEDRITRAAESDAQLDGLLSLDSLNYKELGWHVQPFLKPLFLDGVGYAHYWANPMTGKPYGGQALTRLKTIGHSFSMGHQQLLDVAIRFVTNPRTGEATAQHALIAGSAYLHDESYKGWQGNSHWRGIIVCHDVRDGAYDGMFISLDYLCRRYEGMPVSKFLAKQNRARR